MEVLKEIRDEVRATNGRLDQTNSRLGSLESRVEQGVTGLSERIDLTNSRLESLEHRVEQGMAGLSERIDLTNSRLGSLETRVGETNTRLETVEGRLRFVEKRLKDGFDELSQKNETVAARQLEAEANTTAEIVVLGKTIMSVVRNHEVRITTLEQQHR